MITIGRFYGWAALLAAVVAGCEAPPPSMDWKSQWTVESLRQMQVNQATVERRALYPYQFVTDQAELNELGWEDVLVLAGHYRQYPGRLSIRRGQADDSLYEARVETVLKALASAGVDRDRMNVSDQLPRAGGMPTQHVIEIITEDVESQYFDGSQGDYSLPVSADKGL